MDTLDLQSYCCFSKEIIVQESILEINNSYPYAKEWVDVDALRASEVTLGTAGGSIHEITAWVYKYEGA